MYVSRTYDAPTPVGTIMQSLQDLFSTHIVVYFMLSTYTFLFLKSSQ